MVSTEATRNDITEKTARALLEVVPTVMHLLRGEMRRQTSIGLSVPQLRILAFISRNKGASLSEAADDVGITRATASALVDRLVKKGLVNRTGDPEERRRIVLSLTSQGTKHLDLARSKAQAYIADILVNVPQPQLTTIMEGMILLQGIFKGVQAGDNHA